MPGNKLPSTELLEELCSRFILNVPAEEIETFERLLFLVEQAHWFYEDVSVERDPSLRSLNIKDFTQLIFQKVPGLEAYQGLCHDLLKSWQQYKATVPVNGAIMLDPSLEKCLLVKGWKSGSGWGFPRGKIAKNEGDEACAVREVKEETGFDISGRFSPADFVEVFASGQRSKLYIVPGVPENTIFAPQVRKEIGAFAWHNVSELPCTKEEASQTFLSESGDRHRFFMVWPYIRALRRWIKRNKRAHLAKAAKSGGQAAPSGGSAAAPAAHAQAPVQAVPVQAAPAASAAPPSGPGQALLNFKFDREAIMRHLAFA